MNPWFVRPSKASRYGLRLFCFPFAGGASANYRHWPGRLPPHVEVIAVELPGRGARIKDKPFLRMGPMIQALAEAISIAATSPETREKGRRAVRVAARYSRQIALRAYEDLMDGLLEKQKARSPGAVKQLELPFR